MTKLEATAFVQQHFQPADIATESVVQALRTDLGLYNHKNIISALCGFLMACRTLQARQSDLLAFPLGKGHYDTGKAAYLSVRDHLIAEGIMELAQASFAQLKRGAGKGTSAVYRVLIWFDLDGLRFKQGQPVHSVKVRTPKLGRQVGAVYSDWSKDIEDAGKVLSHKDCEARYGVGYAYYSAKTRDYNAHMAMHPLVIDGDSFSYVVRKFNNSSISLGGRYYGAYSQLPKDIRKTAKIDGESVTEVDLTASGLSILLATKGQWYPSGTTDPYRLIPWVTDRRSRDFAKVLISAMISVGGIKKQFTEEMKSDFPELCLNHKNTDIYTKAILEVFPVFKTEFDGLDLMFKESEWMADVIDTANADGITVFPLHDGVICKIKHGADVRQIMVDCFLHHFGKRPLLKVGYH
jgi:hypothetical protein